jgi:hypothetical protein
MSRIARTPAKRGSQIALSLTTAASAAVVAATMSLGSAPVAKADVADLDAIASLASSIDSAPLAAADALLPAADPAETVMAANAISYLIDFYFPSQFTSTGAPAGLLGLGAYGLDQYLFGPNGLLPFVDQFLEPFVLKLTGTAPTDAASALMGAAAEPASAFVGLADPAETVNSANAFSYLVDFFFPSQFTSTGAPAGLLGLGAYGLDQYLFGPNGLLPFVDQFLEPFVLKLTGTAPTDAASALMGAAADPLTDAVSALDPSSVVGAVEPGAVVSALDPGAVVSALDPGAVVSALDPSALVGAVEPGAVLGGLDSVVDALVNTGALF